MKIAYYCQHVLGIGHFHRSLAICRALARQHEVILIVGGPEVHPVPEPIQLYKLPGLQMDNEFKNLAPTACGADLEEVKQQRKEMLLSFFHAHSPDVFLVELYPFGRKAFRFELDPVLQAIRQGTLPPCRCYVSLRDILVERPNDRDKFEKRAVEVLNTSFDGLLIHSDEAVVTLEETFSRFSEIAIPYAYTGFVTPEVHFGSRDDLRKRRALQPEDKLIVVSIGGGNVGGELLQASIAAFRLLDPVNRYHLQIFTGPYFPEHEFKQLQSDLPDRTTVSRFTDNFPDWLQAADVSISMAGYNTCMNIIRAGVPALVYPFAQNHEQMFRAQRLQKRATLKILTERDLEPDKLSQAMLHMSACTRYSSNINLDGARGSLEKIEAWHTHDQHHAIYSQ